MAESVYKVVELVGTSTESWKRAATAAVETAAETLRDLRVAVVVEQGLQIEEGKGPARQSHTRALWAGGDLLVRTPRKKAGSDWAIWSRRFVGLVWAHLVLSNRASISILVRMHSCGLSEVVRRHPINLRHRWLSGRVSFERLRWAFGGERRETAQGVDNRVVEGWADCSGGTAFDSGYAVALRLAIQQVEERLQGGVRQRKVVNYREALERDHLPSKSWFGRNLGPKPIGRRKGFRLV
jgi:flavin-binding protein dodecin